MLIQKVRELKVWKKRPFVIFTVIFFLSLLFLGIRISKPCREYLYDGSASFSADVGVGQYEVYSGISLAPGVYRVELKYETDTDQVALCNVKDGTVFHGGLLCNGEHMYSALEQTGYDMWLYEGTEDLQVVIEYGGNGNLTVGSLHIMETKQLWTMLFTIALFLGTVGYVCIIFYYYDKRYAVAAEKKHVFFCVTVISLIASIPYICGYSITGADLTYHLQRIEGVKDGLLSGQFPVRLEPRWVYDHGYANGIFYCNALLYFPALLRMVGFTITAGYNIYCIGLNIATAWISYYCFSRMFGKRHIGIVCSGLYTLSIFRIYKLTITGATGEGSAVTFIPLVIYGLYRIFTEDPKEKRYKTAWIPVMLGYAGLMQTHVLTCEITAFVTILFCLVFIRKIFRLNTFMELAKGAASALLVSAWYLVPFLDFYLTQDVHIRHVSARTIQDRGLYFAQQLFHFWENGLYTPTGENGMQYSHPVGIGMVLVIALGLFLILWYSGVLRKLKDRSIRFIKITALMGVMLLFMSLNIFPWDRIQSLNSVTASLVSSLQFPNRFLGWGTVCLVMIFGFCLWYFDQNHKKGYWIMTAVAVIGITTSGMYLLDYVNSDQNYYKLYNEEGMGFGYVSGAEYLIEGTDIEQLTFADAVAGDGVEIRDYEKGCLQGELACKNLTDTVSYVDIPLLLYKGYEAVDAATGQEIELCAGENNVIRVVIPAGYAGTVQVSFESPVYWRISELISALTIIVLSVTGLRYRRKKA